MRRLLSILLLAVSCLPLLSPMLAFGAGPDGSLPACCRRSGVHHCMLGMGERSSPPSLGPQLRAIFPKCPFCPGSTAVSHPNLGSVSPERALFAGVLTSPTAAVQTESLWRIARSRSRQKRGPPSLLG